MESLILQLHKILAVKFSSFKLKSSIWFLAMGVTLSLNIVTEILIPAHTVVGIAFSLVQWLIVSRFKVSPSNDSNSNNIGAEKNGYSNSANLLSFCGMDLWETEMMGWSWWEEGLIWVFDEGEAIDGGDVVEEDVEGEGREKMAWAESSKKKKNYNCKWWVAT